MTTAAVAGTNPDRLGETPEGRDVMVIRVVGIASADSPSKAGIEDADLLVLTGMDGATAIAVAEKQNPDVRVVTYTYGTLPEFARRQVDLAIDPNLFAIGVVAEEPA